MADKTMFISYAHDDMQEINWLERLILYLAPLRRKEIINIWDDREIETGSEWRVEIERALDQSLATILLVGPAFLASEFIMTKELPFLLDAWKKGRIKIYPLVIGYCGYKQSILEPFQAFNDPNKPLEALLPPDQNRWLSEISQTVERDLRQIREVTITSQDIATDTIQTMLAISKSLGFTRKSFNAQARRRNQLVKALETRLRIKENLQYEKFFFRYYVQLNEEEKFEFEQIRAITQGVLYKHNQKILDILNEHPQAFAEIPTLEDLQQHLVFWLNKYEQVFTRRSEMCLLYTGVEDGVPFPRNIDKEIKSWIETHQQDG